MVVKNKIYVERRMYVERTTDYHRQSDGRLRRRLHRLVKTRHSVDCPSTITATEPKGSTNRTSNVVNLLCDNRLGTDALFSTLNTIAASHIASTTILHEAVAVWEEVMTTRRSCSLALDGF